MVQTEISYKKKLGGGRLEGKRYSRREEGECCSTVGSRKAGLVYYYNLPIYIFHVTWLDIIALHDFFFFFGVI